MDGTKKKTLITIVSIIALGALVYLDQMTKGLAVQHLKDQIDIPLIKDVLVLHYLENTGAAFGLLKNKGWLFVVLAVIFLLFGGYLFNKMPKTKRYIPLHIITVFLLAGAIGNIIDRVSHSYVIDFIYFVLINFPVFNVADMYVTVSMSILILLIIFFYKDADFDFLNKPEGKENVNVEVFSDSKDITNDEDSNKDNNKKQDSDT